MDSLDIANLRVNQIAQLMYMAGCGERKVGTKVWQLNDLYHDGNINRFWAEVKQQISYWQRRCNELGKEVPAELIQSEAEEPLKEQSMSQTNLLLTQNPDFKYVGVKFLDYDNGKTYHYKTMLHFEPEDYTVIMSPDGNPKTVRVVEVINPL